MKMIHVTPELAPLYKVGGLADVASGLSLALTSLGHEVSIFLPKCFDDPSRYPPSQCLGRYHLPHFSYAVYKSDYQNMELYFFELQETRRSLTTNAIYGGFDETTRFLYLARAQANFLHNEWRESSYALHLHDWTAAGLLLFLSAPVKKRIKKTLLTIHNLQHQGQIPVEEFHQDFDDPEGVDRAMLKDPYHGDYFNLLQYGIDKADAITVVSPTYAREIQTKEASCGLHQVLHRNARKIHGILNGIDTSYWSLEVDPFLFDHTSEHADLEEVLACKQKNKTQLFETLGLTPRSGPLVCSITRMVRQKGPYLIEQALDFTQKNEGSFILLYGALDNDLKKHFETKEKQLSSSPHVHMFNGFDEKLAHQTYAAADMIVIPSLFEPCGLTQLIAMRYGCIPIVHKTGGLKDTVGDVDDPKTPKHDKNGFAFAPHTTEALLEAMRRAFITYHEPKRWKGLIERALHRDVSWTHSAKEYEKLFQS